MPVNVEGLLLCCPFCGGGAVLHQSNTNAWIVCGTPGCGCEQIHDTAEQVIAAWNTRTLKAPDGEVAERLIEAISHGDDEHRAWLREAIVAFFAGRPVPECRGSGRKEAEIARLSAQLEAMKEALAPFARAHGTVASRDVPDDRWPDATTLDCDDAVGFAEHVTVGNLRHARATLTQGQSHDAGLVANKPDPA